MLNCCMREIDFEKERVCGRRWGARDWGRKRKRERESKRERERLRERERERERLREIVSGSEKDGCLSKRI